MVMQIISHTPTWVFVLFAVLLALGLSQLLTRTTSLKRITILPIAMLGLAVSGVVSAFGHGSDGASALGIWAVCALAAGALLFFRPLPEGTRYAPDQRQFTLPGSAVPLALIMGIFCTKYAVGVALGMHPELAQSSNFALGVSALYGVFSGVFAARAAKLWRLALSHEPIGLLAQRDPW
jgi:hypothetical protein